MPVGKKTSSFFYQLNNTILQDVDHNPYLGLLISKDLKWGTNIDEISKKCTSYQKHQEMLTKLWKNSLHSTSKVNNGI